MGKDIFCLICGVGFRHPSIGMNVSLYDDVKRYFSYGNYDWCCTATGITKDNNYIDLSVKNNKINDSMQALMKIDSFQFDSKNIIAHTDCIKLLENEYNYKLKYGDFELEPYTNLIVNQDYELEDDE